MAKILVFELLNSDLREVFVGITSRGLPDISRLIATAAPASIAHWNGEARSNIREVETFRTRQDAEAFVENYIIALNRGSDAWKVLCETRL